MSGRFLNWLSVTRNYPAAWWAIGGMLSFAMFWWADPAQAQSIPVVGDLPWWAIPVSLFVFTMFLGVVAVLAGVGGGVLFVPIVSGFAPFIHIDFVRGAGLFVALAGALTAGPRLIRENLVNVRLAIPVCLAASIGSIMGAMLGLALPVEYIQVALGLVILSMAAFINIFRPKEGESPSKVDSLALFFGIENEMVNPHTGATYTWRPKNVGLGLVMFVGVGVVAGLFGLGAGWANVPVFNLVMGLPLKHAVAGSYFMLANISAALVYFNQGALLPLVVIPSVMGVVIGARVGTKILVKTRPTVIRRVVTGVLVLSGVRALLRGFGI